MRLRRRLTLTASLLAGALALAPAAGAHAASTHAASTHAGGFKVFATFKGRTSQGKKIRIQYLKSGHEALIRFRTVASGTCPVNGLGDATMSTTVADQAHGKLPIPRKWGWETKGPNYDIKIRETSRHGSTLKGQLWATWQTSLDNARTCTTPTITWTVKRS